MKKIVIPGDIISEERKRLGANVFVSDGKIYSKVLGITDDQGETASVVPLEGKYVPRVDDTIIGVVTRVVFAGCGLDINSFSDVFLPKSAIRTDLRLGDKVALKVKSVNELKEADVSYPKLLKGGEIIEIKPVRTPRLIGKNCSMLDLLQKGTDAELFIGKNGRVWAKDGDLKLLREAVKFIEENSYKSNLTNTVEEFLGKNRS
jgi:exosome complex component RRP4